MATLQVRVDDELKKAADFLFSSLGLDTSTAIRVFLKASLECNGMPFPVTHKSEFSEALEDARSGRNLHGPYKNVDDAIKAMLEE